MGAPQIMVLMLWAISLVGNCALHGQLKDPSTYSLPRAVVGIGIFAALLTWGGFFS